MTTEQFLFICENQSLWQTMCKKLESEKMQDYRDKCRAYECNKRRQRKAQLKCIQ